MIVPSNHTTIGAYSLEHKEHYEIIIDEEWPIFVLQQVHRDFLPRQLFDAYLLIHTFSVLSLQLKKLR